MWSVRLGGRANDHLDRCLVQGFLKSWPPRGTCEVRGAGPNLWFAAAGSLGFKVTTVRCAYTPFLDLIGPFCGHPRVLSATPRRCNLLPDVVFSDLGSLPLARTSIGRAGRRRTSFPADGQTTIRAPRGAPRHGSALPVGLRGQSCWGIVRRGAQLRGDGQLLHGTRPPLPFQSPSR